MNVFILDRNMEKSAKMLDDSHLRSQINEACQILMANYNKCWYPNAKIGHVHHTVTKFYLSNKCIDELFTYLCELIAEYEYRFKKKHQNFFWARGFIDCISDNLTGNNTFEHSKTYINGTMTNDIQAIRKYISTKPMKKKPTWTNREKPDWWEV